MKHIGLFFACIVLLASCAKDGIPVSVFQPGKDDFNVTFLFESNGLRVYRFYDAGEYRYFAIGAGRFLPQEQGRAQSNGKTTTVHHWYDGVESDPGQ